MLTSLLLLPLLSGCKVVDAPESLEELVVFGFVHFEDEEDFLIETAEGLIPIAEDSVEELTEGYRVDELTSEDLTAVGIENADVQGIIGAMGLADYTHDIDEVARMISHRQKDELFEDTLEYEVLEESERVCFLDHRCLEYFQRIRETTSVPLLGDATREFDSAYRWVEHEDYGWILFIRTLSPDPVTFSSNVVKVNQQHSFAMLYEPGNTARRVEAFWVDAQIIGLDVPDSYAVDTAVQSMADRAELVDTEIEGG